MKKFLFPTLAMMIPVISFAQSVDIIKVKGIDVDPEANGIYIKTTKGNYTPIPLGSMSDKSIKVIEKAIKNKSCVKLVESSNSSGTIYTATLVKCPTNTTNKTVKKKMTQAQIDACVNNWTNAHRASVGEDAIIGYDMINEWEAWCKQGKKP